MIAISVIMSTFNTPEEYLRASIESILKQSFENFELIIVDDGSTKNDISIVKSYHDSRIVLIENQANKGLPYSLNRALLIAKGKYIVRMDSDDISLPTRLQCQYDFMEKNSDIAVAGCHATKIGAKKGIMVSLPSKIDLRTYLLFKNPIIHPSTIIRKEFIDHYELTYDLACFRGQDYELWTRVALCGNLDIMPDLLLKYRFHDNQLTSESSKEIRRKNGIALYQKFLPKYGIELNDRLYEAYYDLVNARPFNKIEQLKELYDSLGAIVRNVNSLNKKAYNQYLDYFYFYNLLGNLAVKRYRLSFTYIKLLFHPIRFVHFFNLFLAFELTKIKYKRIQAKNRHLDA